MLPPLTPMPGMWGKSPLPCQGSSVLTSHVQDRNNISVHKTAKYGTAAKNRLRPLLTFNLYLH